MTKYEIGDKFGRWELLERIQIPVKRDKNGNYKNTSKWICRCECGTIKEIWQGSLTSKNGSGKSTSCGCYQREKHVLKMWKGYGEISRKYFSYVKLNAQKRNLIFKITIEYIWELFQKQNGKCVYTGIDLYLPEKGKIKKDRSSQTASLDRIDSSIGYIQGNVQWIHKDINKMKQDFSEEKFLNYIEQIYNYKIKDKNANN